MFEKNSQVNLIDMDKSAFLPLLTTYVDYKIVEVKPLYNLVSTVLLNLLQKK